MSMLITASINSSRVLHLTFRHHANSRFISSAHRNLLNNNLYSYAGGGSESLSLISRNISTENRNNSLGEPRVQSSGFIGEDLDGNIHAVAGDTPLSPGNDVPQLVGHLFSDSAPVLAAGDLLHQIHGLPGMDWMKTILLTTVGIRLFAGLPIAVFQQKVMAKLENLQPEVKQLATDLARETSIAVKLYNWDKKKANSAFQASFKRHWRKMVEDHNCHPLRAVFLTWLQLPFWLGFSCALRNIVYALPEPRTSEMLLSWMQIAGENPFWIESLASADHFFLPGIFLTANLLNIQINSVRKLTVPQTKLRKAIPWVLRIAIVGISAVAAYTPSAITLYWATSSVAVLIQNIVMKARPVRRFFRIPPTPSHS